ncbi:CsbD family protein [Roseomonas sp. SSH11]|uniref:CsbD family protein n=1 Tax=Pararoseomonas baculiformis TaxID=2820812 RepID=A0ABS4AH66_9PROT|nr:CsbD family protein [Pararoseomonas baculiformis]MBP0446361.1 CsbD family protein [Pararoseomonas baculiformis]
MDSDRIIGAGNKAAGEVQEGIGGLIGDSRTQARGQSRQLRGEAQNQIGQLEDYIRDQPLTAAAVAVGIGWLIGRLRII